MNLLPVGLLLIATCGITLRNANASERDDYPSCGCPAKTERLEENHKDADATKRSHAQLEKALQRLEQFNGRTPTPRHARAQREGF